MQEADQATVGVVIPSYNPSEFLEETVASVLAPTHLWFDAVPELIHNAIFGKPRLP